MKYATRVVMQMTDDGLQLIEKDEVAYDGPWELGKGDDYAKQVSREQLALEKAQIARQNAEFDYVKSNIAKYLTGDIGFSPEQMALLRSQLLDNNALAYSDAGSSVRDALAARGADGSMPVGGNYVKGISSLLASQASNKASGLLNLGIADRQQALNNKFNTASVLSGNAAALNSSISTTGSVGSSALSDYIKSKEQGFGAHFMNALGSSLGAGIGTFATGGFGGLGSMVGKLGGTAASSAASAAARNGAFGAVGG